MRSLVAFIAFVVGTPVMAQIVPFKSEGDSRIHAFVPIEGQRVALTAYPDIPLTILFRQDEHIRQVVIADGSAFDAHVAPGENILTIEPLRSDAASPANVTTDRGSYFFDLATGAQSQAAVMVKVQDRRASNEASQTAVITSDLQYAYRLSGDRALRPVRVADNGIQTFIEWGPDQTASAVFGIGATGDEEVVNGYMRHGLFVIDRVYPKLVFRIDKDKARAKRIVERGR